MAAGPITIKYFDRAHGEVPELIADEVVSIDGDQIKISSDVANRFTLVNGSDFEVDNGVFIDGQVDGITIANGKNQPYMSLTGLYSNLVGVDATDPNDIYSTVMQNFNLRDMKIFGSNYDDGSLTSYEGDDILHGRKGDDVLDAAEGNDQLYGGKGNDVFVFNSGDGQDRIMDFDANAAHGQDLIQAEFDDVISIAQDGKDTVIDFDNGDTLTLVGVKFNQIDESDFQFLT